MRYKGDGPAVMLGNSASIFPAQLAAYWRSKGMDVVLVTYQEDAPLVLPGGTRVVRSCEYETRLTRTVTRSVLNPILRTMERTLPRFKQRFTRITGMSANTELWMSHFADYVTRAWPAVRAVMAQSPRFVFGQEVMTYGVATALCRGVPRIIFPWGGDVLTYAESSPYQFAMAKYSLRSMDLIVPSSTTAARHISERFGVPSEKVQGVSWGVDREVFRRADTEKRKIVCTKWGIDPEATIFSNVRRFRPAWGGFVALEAFMQLATESPNSHFILFGGEGTEEFTKQAYAKLENKGLLDRFTLLNGDVPLATCAELMSVSDVFLSLLGRGDMRSSSVLQATASGGVPIVTDSLEYREMERTGFAGFFVQPDRVEDVLDSLRFCVRNPNRLTEIRAINHKYIAAHEDHQKQMDKLLDLIQSICSDYRLK